MSTTQRSAGKAQFTPGPWFVLNGQVRTRFDNEREDRLAACICDPGDGCQENGALLPRAEQNANAHLIASAPDLLAALQAMVDAEDASIDQFTATEIDRIEAAMKQARAAIARATGQEGER